MEDWVNECDWVCLYGIGGDVWVSMRVSGNL